MQLSKEQKTTGPPRAHWRRHAIAPAQSMLLRVQAAAFVHPSPTNTQGFAMAQCEALGGAVCKGVHDPDQTI